MNLSVAYNFDKKLIARLAQFPQVKDIYGKLTRDAIGGGRSSYTLRGISWRTVKESIDEAHRCGIKFNYLLNGASLAGLEQTRSGQKSIRDLIDRVDGSGADSVTVSLPYLLRLVKKTNPRLAVRVGVFALVDSAPKARQWEDLGADSICLSGIACNRDFARLRAIRRAVRCSLQIIANASCLSGCSHEMTHMQLLTQSSRSKDPLGGFCLDYCFLHCSFRRLNNPAEYIRSCWIRPEDLHFYEELGFNTFKLVERSCPSDLIIKRTAAYCARSFDGNLLEIAGPVAQIKKELGASLAQRLKMMWTMIRASQVRTSSLLAMKKYAEEAMPHDFSRGNAPVYIDNKALEGFLQNLPCRDNAGVTCADCTYCEGWADKVVSVNPQWRERMMRAAGSLDDNLLSGRHWGVGKGER